MGGDSSRCGPVELNLLVFTENLLENTMGCSEPHQCSLGTAPCYLLFMLTCATLMTSSHSEGLVSAAIYAILRTLVRGVSLPPNAELVGCIGNCSVLPGPINVTAFNQWYSMMGYTY